jgi:hypothetical protein
MLVAGAAALRRYPGLAVTLYAVQLLVSVIAAWVMATALAAAFARQPLFDQAVDGDTLAAVLLLLDNTALFTALAAVAFGAAAFYAAISWFLTGGLIATILESPTGRRAVAERFGAGGAATFFAYARLWLWCLIPYAVSALTFVVGLAYVADDLHYALTACDALAAVLPTALPALALAWLTALAAGYARVDLTRNPGKSAARALACGYVLVGTRWRALVHSLLYAVTWLAITALFLLVVDYRAMSGAAGALCLFALRQLTAILRFAAKLALIGGQVELARGVVSSPRGGAEAR